MDRIPAAGVTGGTVAASGEGLSGSIAEQCTAAGTMTGRAGVMRLRITVIDQRRRIIVTARTTGSAGCHQGAVIGCTGVDRTPATGMTGGAISTRCKIFANRETSQRAI